MGTEPAQAMAFKGLKKFSSGAVVGWSPSDYSVYPHPFCQFYACFTHIYIRQDGLSVTKVYVRLCQFMWVGRDVELDNILCFRLRYICLTVENFCKIIVIIISFFQTLKMNLLRKMTNIYEK